MKWAKRKTPETRMWFADLKKRRVDKPIAYFIETQLGYWFHRLFFRYYSCTQPSKTSCSGTRQLFCRTRFWEAP